MQECEGNVITYVSDLVAFGHSIGNEQQGHSAVQCGALFLFILGSLLAVNSQFSILIGQKMQSINQSINLYFIDKIHIVCYKVKLSTSNYNYFPKRFSKT